MYASYDGTVRYSFYDKFYGRGVFVEIIQDNGYVVRYLHMREFSVNLKENDKVKAGDYIGKVSCTGEAYGSHLHYDVNKSLNSLDYTQPLDFFKNINFTYSY